MSKGLTYCMHGHNLFITFVKTDRFLAIVLCHLS